MAYNGTVELIAGITPKNNGDFPLVNAKDVYVTDNLRLDGALQALRNFDYTVCTTNNTTPNIVSNGTLAPSANTMYRIYLVSTSSNSGNIYSEYITIQNGSNYSWEKIGSTDVDMSAYVLKNDIIGMNVTSPLVPSFTNGILKGLSLDISQMQMQGATASVAGGSGVVPAPSAGDNSKFLRGDGTWAEVSGGGSGGGESPDLTNYPTKSDIGNITVNSPLTKTTNNTTGMLASLGISAMQGATASAAGSSGIVPAPAIADRYSVLSGDGNWVNKPGYTFASPLSATPSYYSGTQIVSNYSISIPNFTGASASSNGSRGIVPLPQAGDNTKFLRGDGTWAEVSSGGSSGSGSIDIMKIDIRIPANTLQYSYIDQTGWITADTDCYAHDMAVPKTSSNTTVETSISWTFSDGYVTFEAGSAVNHDMTFSFAMIKSVSS